MKLEITEVFGYRVKNDGRGNLKVQRETLPAKLPAADYGCDPIGDGTFRMVPSGDVVDRDECRRRMDAAAAARGMRRVW